LPLLALQLEQRPSIQPRLGFHPQRLLSGYVSP
jgi:hypothetical protein